MIELVVLESSLSSVIEAAVYRFRVNRLSSLWFYVPFHVERGVMMDGARSSPNPSGLKPYDVWASWWPVSHLFCSLGECEGSKVSFVHNPLSLSNDISIRATFKLKERLRTGDFKSLWCKKSFLLKYLLSSGVIITVYWLGRIRWFALMSDHFCL